MKDVKVLGSGRINCKTTIALIEQAAQDKSVPVQIEKVQDMQAIIGYGVMATPGVAVEGKMVPAGGLLTRDKIVGWLA